MSKIPIVPMSWDVIERRAGFDGTRRIVERDVLPQLANAKARIQEMNPINGTYGPGCFVGMVALMLAFVLSSALGIFGFIIAGVIGWFVGKPLILKMAARYMRVMIDDLAFRHEVFSPLATHLGLEYVAAPGGSMGIIQQQSMEGPFQEAFRELGAAFEKYGGQDEAVAAARASGLVELATVIHIGKADEETKKARETGLTRLEDGFAGDHSGLHFDAFEVVRSSRRTDDGKVYPAEHALLIVLRLPRSLQGTTQFRSRKIGWHRTGDAQRLEDVKLESTEFADRFRVRSNDQVEARFVFTPDVMARVTELAHGEDIRATAQAEHLVFAIEGPNRFDLTSADTGLEGDEAVRLAVQQIGEMLDLVEAVSGAFGIS
ncbi:MAG: DUF3137 domain-containing protein [Pseudomonadota bacterium]